MNASENPVLSRRKWLGLATASVGTGMIPPARAQVTSGSSSDIDSGARTYNVREFGAKGDGSALETSAFQRAIDACFHDHGGIVLVPAGVYQIGTIELKSNVTLRLSAGSKLLGSADGKQYHSVDEIPLDGDATLEDGNVALIYAVSAENISIEGNGTIDGQGSQFFSATRGVPPPSGRGGAQRPYHLLFHRCKNVTVRDVFLTACAFHSIRIIQSSFIKLEGLRIYNRVNRNNDGFHFISSEYVHVNNCDVQCQDDACALFGSCKFVTVTNCSFSTRWSVFRFGGGVAENIAVSNCLIYDTYGCPIKMRCGPGSRFENMTFSNLIMRNVTGPISIGVGPREHQHQSPAGKGSEVPGIVRNISFSGIHATVVVPQQLPDVPFPSTYNPGEIKSCIALNAVEGTIERITFDDVHVTFPGGGTPEEAAVRNVSTVIGEYYAGGVLPAYALYARNVQALSVNNVRCEVTASEARPAIVFDHVTDAAANGITLCGTKQSESVLRLIESRDVLITAPRLIGETAVFLQAEGAGTQSIIIDGGDLSKAARPIVLSSGAHPESVNLRN